jgi:type IV pilus assembly protein PilV
VVKSLRRPQRGATLIEVLVTLVIIAFGLLGMAGLQMRMQVSELEAYQRSQALMLLNDMASRIGTNRANADAYVTGTDGTGTGANCAGMGTANRAQTDLKEWCSGLQGAAEYTASGGATVQRGAMIGARGCVEKAADGDFVISVVWQGLTPISAPPDSVQCGIGQYNATASCARELCRRIVTTVLRIASLT